LSRILPENEVRRRAEARFLVIQVFLDISHKYVPIDLAEHSSALPGLTIVEPSDGSLR
jgi:hypothetical protein